jgi:hypothetical protein
MLSRQEDQAERRRVLQNHQRVREQEQTGTFLSHTHDDIHQGRFAAIGPAVVVGADPIPNYPAAAAHQSDPCGQEPSLGYRIDELGPLEPASSFEAQATGPTLDDAPSHTPLGDGQRADVGSFSPEPMAAQSQMSSPSARGDDVRTERPPYRRY